MKKIFPLILLLLTFSLPSHVVADDKGDMEKMLSQLNTANEKLGRGQFEGEDLNAWTKLSIKMKSVASLCVANNEAALKDLKASMDGLGEEVKGEDPEVTKKRAAYQKEKEELDKKLAKCNLYIVSSDEVTALIDDAEKSYFKQKYLVRSPNMIQLVMAYLENPVSVLQNSGEFVFKHSGIREIDVQGIVLSIAAAAFDFFWYLAA